MKTSQYLIFCLKRLRRLAYFFLMIGLFLTPKSIQAQLNIESSNTINFSILEINVVDAGLDFQNDFSTTDDAILLSVNILPQNLQNTTLRSWRVDIRKNDIDWHDNLDLFVRVTGNGNSNFNTSLQNDFSYQQIQDFDNLFFNGTGWINNIPIQVKLSGVSVIIPAKSYATELVFTLLDD